MSTLGRSEEIRRRRELAHERGAEPETPPEPSMEIIEFTLAYERHALEMSAVSEVFPFRELTPLPGLPPHFTGIVNVRGRIIAAVDLKKFFGLPAPGIADLHEMIIVKSGTAELGILVDFVVGSRLLPLSAIAPPPAQTDARSGYLRGIAPGPVALLDIARLLEDPRMTVNEEVGA